MLNILEAFKNIPAVLFRPGRFFSNAKDQGGISPGSALWAIGLVLLIGTLLLFGFSFMEAGSVGSTQSQIKQPVKGAKWLAMMSSDAHRPWNRLLFPVYWLTFLGLAGVGRRLIIRMMGDPGSTGSTFAVTFLGAIPLVVSGILLGIVGILMPASTDVSMVWPRVALSLLIFLGALIWEALITIKGFRIFHEQNTGRAGITWFAAYFLLFVILCGFITLPLSLFS